VVPILLTALSFFCPAILGAQELASANEIPIERCDRLPVVKVRIDGADMRFLLDTGATTMLNLKSFSSGRSQKIQVTSWSGTAATSAREVSLPEFTLGAHRLKDLKLPAIDLSPIGKACGGQIDGILGVDLLDKMGVTIDLKRQVASAGTQTPDAKTLYDQMELGMHHCMTAFEAGKVAELQDCFDPEIVFYTPQGEFRGRKQVMEYLKERYLKFAPDLHYKMNLHDVNSIDSPKEQIAGHGMSMCRRHNGHWPILNLHNSFLESPPQVDSPAEKHSDRHRG
jgi:hypothetical protein